MSEPTVNLISNLRAIEPRAQPHLRASTQPMETIASQKSVAAKQEKRQSQAESEHPQDGNLSGVSIHFRVDEQTNEVTIFIVDHKTKKVLRSIPASELQKLQAGDLLKLTA